jgi:hypothetical protein
MLEQVWMVKMEPSFRTEARKFKNITLVVHLLEP